VECRRFLFDRSKALHAGGLRSGTHVFRALAITLHDSRTDDALYGFGFCMVEFQVCETSEWVRDELSDLDSLVTKNICSGTFTIPKVRKYIPVSSSFLLILFLF
jgi:hypothetical protein